MHAYTRNIYASPDTPDFRIHYEYDERGNLLSTRRVEERSGSERMLRSWSYDEQNRVTSTFRASTGSGSVDYRSGPSVFEEQGRPREFLGSPVTYADDSIVWTQPHWTKSWYFTGDDWQRHDSQTGAGLVRTEIFRDEVGRAISLTTSHPSDNGTALNWAWGPYGITEEVAVRPQGTTVSAWSYDDRGNVTSARENGFTDSMRYDADGHVVAHDRTHGSRAVTTYRSTRRWSAGGHLLGGSHHIVDASRHAEWEWENGILVRGVFRTDPPFTQRVEYDYACLAEVMRNMPRREFEELPARVIRDPEAVLRGLWGSAYQGGPPNRNRYDPSEWPFGPWNDSVMLNGSARPRQ